MIFLTDQEREKFALYLRQHAESDMGLAEQIESSNMGPVGEVMITQNRNRAIAFTIVAEFLTNVETDTIG